MPTIITPAARSAKSGAQTSKKGIFHALKRRAGYRRCLSPNAQRRNHHRGVAVPHDLCWHQDFLGGVHWPTPAAHGDGVFPMLYNALPYLDTRNYASAPSLSAIGIVIALVAGYFVAQIGASTLQENSESERRLRLERLDEETRRRLR